MAPWRLALHGVFFGAETRAGRAFDMALLGRIATSVIGVSLESVEGVKARRGKSSRRS